MGIFRTLFLISRCIYRLNYQKITIYLSPFALSILSKCKKIVFYLFLSCLFSQIMPLNGFTQQSASPNSLNRLTAGSLQIGLKDGYGHSKNLNYKRQVFHFHTTYYVANHLALGVGASWAKERWKYQNRNIKEFNHELTVGPFARYQLLSGRISPFFEISCQFGRTWSNQVGMNQITRIVFINPGLSFRLIDRLRADVSYDVRFYGYYESFGQVLFGLNYMFTRK